MKVLGYTIPDDVKGIYTNLKQDLKIHCSIQRSDITRVGKSKSHPHNYTIELSIDDSDTEKEIGLKFIHEFSHIYQFENGYPMLLVSQNTDLETCKICEKVNDLILDVDVNERLKTVYNYDSTFYSDEKFCQYSLFFPMLKKRHIARFSD